jgi:hypothetical protein
MDELSEIDDPPVIDLCLLAVVEQSQGNPNPHLPVTKTGKPQIAVMTISGNDVGFDVHYPSLLQYSFSIL